ncbi:GNAT family N-acetyltransferase [Amycolatopsis suaedae]|uniref:N-acetyltransferase n=1 Tax=Amycolatopsis suaedae TaxID=2510978 RepID=A0A4Q7J0Q8_9PSEU|nr:GNAT family N-acetyltransferase [Amycolatopsis suaedae]RZQ59976.1 N-acetyltransferase [Amycolatopsis suaedae]
MTATSSTRFVELTADEFRDRLREALDLYVAAMHYPQGTAEQRAPMWLTHVLREGWRCVVALDTDGTMLGLAYGYRGRAGQWWHEQVRRGLAQESGDEGVRLWMTDYFELTEIHVRPADQARGIGSDLLRRLLSGVDYPRVLLSTPEGPTRAWRLYRRMGFTDVLRDYYFAGDPRPFAILGRTLPLSE